MQILSVSIENFRGVQSADIRFGGHALLVGPNNTAKTTVLEALDLALGPDRGRGPDSIDEHDFFRGSYYDLRLVAEEAAEDDEEGRETESEHPEIKVIVVLGHLDAEDRIRFRNHLEPWDHERHEPLSPDADRETSPDDFVLRVGFRGWYDQEEDDFDTMSYFLAPEHATGEYDSFGRRSKQAVGFLYLRSIRTARRAATMERGSLLETLLREKASGTRLWETLLDGVRATASAFETNQGVRDALDDIEGLIAELVPLAESEQASGLRVGRRWR